MSSVFLPLPGSRLPLNQKAVPPHTRQTACFSILFSPVPGLVRLAFGTDLGQFCLVKLQNDRAVIAARYFRVDPRIRQRRDKPVRYEEIIDPPADIPLPDLRHKRPPRKGVIPVRIKMPEAVHKAGRQQFGHFAAFFVRKSRIAHVRLPIFQIDLLMGNVQVAADDDRLLGIQRRHVAAETLLPSRRSGSRDRSLLAFGVYTLTR